MTLAIWSSVTVATKEKRLEASAVGSGAASTEIEAEAREGERKVGGEEKEVMRGVKARQEVRRRSCAERE